MPHRTLSPALRHYFSTWPGGGGRGSGAGPEETAIYVAAKNALTQEELSWVESLYGSEEFRDYVVEVAGGPPAPATPPTRGRGIYVASKAHRAWMWRDLRDAGAPITASWIDDNEPDETRDWSGLYSRAVSEAASAGALVLYSEPEENLRGAFIEMGAALGAGVPVFWVGPRLNCTDHPLVTLCTDLEEAMERAKAVLAEVAETPQARDGAEQPFAITAEYIGDRRGLIRCTLPGHELLHIAPDEVVSYGRVVAQGRDAYRFWNGLWRLHDQGGKWARPSAPGESPGLVFELDGDEVLRLEAERVVRRGRPDVDVYSASEMPWAAWRSLQAWLDLSLHECL